MVVLKEAIVVQMNPLGNIETGFKLFDKPRLVLLIVVLVLQIVKFQKEMKYFLISSERCGSRYCGEAIALRTQVLSLENV